MRIKQTAELIKNVTGYTIKIDYQKAKMGINCNLKLLLYLLSLALKGQGIDSKQTDVLTHDSTVSIKPRMRSCEVQVRYVMEQSRNLHRCWWSRKKMTHFPEPKATEALNLKEQPLLLLLR